MKSRFPYIILFITILTAFLFPCCENPFAPGIMKGKLPDDPLGNPKTISGFYTRFMNAYQLRDTTLYGPLINSRFIFTYRDYNRNVDVSWGRDEEMTTTYNMFTQSQDIQLQWNNIVTQIVDSTKTQAQVIRQFNLAIILKGSDVIRTDGAANFILTRPDSNSAWQLLRWRDESNL